LRFCGGNYCHFSVPYFSNSKLILAVLCSAGVTFAALCVPMLQSVFSTVMLPLPQILTALGFSFAVPLAAALTAGTASLRTSGTVTPVTEK
jgi:hypothetical protein